jgi:CHAT domain-containing protein
MTKNHINIAAVALLLFCSFIAPARAQNDPQLMQDFFAKYTEANKARMAGEYDRAVALFNECLDPKYAADETAAGFQPSIHQALGLMYAYYLNLPEEASAHLLKYVESAAPKIQADNPAMAQMNAIAEMQISTAYYMMGDYENAALHAQQSIVFIEVQHQGGMDDRDYFQGLETGYFQIGRSYQLAGDTAKMTENLTKAADMTAKLLALPKTAATPFYERTLSDIYSRMDDTALCIEHFRKYADMIDQNDEGARGGLDINRWFFADCLFRAGQFQETATELDKVIAAEEAQNFVSDEWRSLHLKGRALEKSNDKDGAQAAYEKSIDVIEGQRSGLSAGEDRSAFLDMRLQVYRDIIRLLIDMGRPDDALKYLERSKARSFLDMIGGRKLGARTRDESDALDQQVALEQQITAITQQLMPGAGGTRGANAAEKTQQLRDTRTRYAEVVARIKQMRPEFSSLATVSVPEISDVQSALDADTAVIEYLPAETALYIWVIRKDAVTMRNTPTPSKTIDAQIKQLRSKVTRGAAGDAYVANAQKLYELLLTPVEDLIADAHTLVIVPQGQLHYLPFNMLMKDNVFLIDRFTITLAPSSSALKYILDKGSRLIDAQRLLALGDPHTTLPDLPAAKTEVESIRNDFPEADIYLGDDAVESILYGDKAANADVIHIASHGVFYSETPMFSALALTPDAAANKDGFLQVHEIFGLSLTKTKLVTLSACETGLAAVRGGDELVGLSRAFIYAGTPRIIVSLWSVNDASTGELMKSLYKNMKNGGPAAALRQAQIDLKNNPDFANPFFWAPFQLVGDWK